MPATRSAGFRNSQLEILRRERDRLLHRASTLGQPKPAVLARRDIPEPVLDDTLTFRSEEVDAKVKKQMAKRKELSKC
jgi:hypothetical protein